MAEEVKITGETVEAIRFLIHTKAWQEAYEPIFIGARDEFMRQLINPSLERKNNTSDDYLRGCIATINSLLSFGPALLEEADAAERARREREAAEAGYEERAELGIYQY